MFCKLTIEAAEWCTNDERERERAQRRERGQCHEMMSNSTSRNEGIVRRNIIIIVCEIECPRRSVRDGERERCIFMVGREHMSLSCRRREKKIDEFQDSSILDAFWICVHTTVVLHQGWLGEHTLAWPTEAHDSDSDWYRRHPTRWWARWASCRKRFASRDHQAYHDSVRDSAL